MSKTKIITFLLSSATVCMESLRKTMKTKGSSLGMPVSNSSVFSERISLNGEAMMAPTTVKPKKTKTMVTRIATVQRKYDRITQYQASPWGI